jgi:hypothetical protein
MPRNKTWLAWRLVQAYISAVTNLYQEQKALGINNYLTLHKDNVKEYIKLL